jgi:hydrogenase maturation protein HypF
MDKREQKQKSLSIRIFGIVQGVGFRPFTVKLAYKHGVKGTVKNLGGLVDITASDEAESLDAFTAELLSNAPDNSLIVHHEIREIPFENFSEFTIEPSEDTQGLVFISPDIAVCGDCIREFSDNDDARYMLRGQGSHANG